MYVVGVGLIKVYKVLIRLAKMGALSFSLLMSMSEDFSVLTVITLLPHKSFE